MLDALMRLGEMASDEFFKKSIRHIISAFGQPKCMALILHSLLLERLRGLRRFQKTTQVRWPSLLVK